jgi:hypothetical protein
MSCMYLKNLWRDICGLPEICMEQYDIDSLKRTERNPEFDEARMNRKIIGAFRYGLFGDPNKPSWDRISRAIYELEQYRIDGNDERLLDIANMCELEYTEGNHPKKHFKALDDVTHTKVK